MNDYFVHMLTALALATIGAVGVWAMYDHHVFTGPQAIIGLVAWCVLAVVLSARPYWTPARNC